MRFFSFLLSLVYFGTVFNFSIVRSQSKSLQVNANRLTTQLKKLSTFGMNEKGGNDRLAFSDYDIQARIYLTGYLKDLGLKVYTDAAGNLIAKRGGKKNSLSPILFGSHIDAVPNGGHYDGDVGVMAGIEVLEALIEKSKKESPVNQRATELFYRTQSLINHWNPKSFIEQFSELMGSRDKAIEERKEAGEREAGIEAEIDLIPDTDIAGLRKLQTDHRTKEKTLRYDLGVIRTKINVNKNKLAELEEEQKKLLVVNVKGRQLLSELEVCKDLIKHICL